MFLLDMFLFYKKYHFKKIFEDKKYISVFLFIKKYTCTKSEQLSGMNNIFLIF